MAILAVYFILLHNRNHNFVLTYEVTLNNNLNMAIGKEILYLK